MADMNYAPSTWLLSDKVSAPKGADTLVELHVAPFAKAGALAKALDVAGWQEKNFTAKPGLHVLTSNEGPGFALLVDKPERAKHHEGLFTPSPFALARNAMGSVVRMLSESRAAALEVHFSACDEETISGVIAGLEIAHYAFHRPRSLAPVKFYANKKLLAPSRVKEAAEIGRAVNVARHLVNLPPNMLTPVTFSMTVKDMLRSPDVKIAVWDDKRLAQEGMGLHLAVGRGAEHAPCLVHIRYRPSGAKGAPLALVGKGITFDSGGLDIKPAAGMRWMKKDMGGAASVTGIMSWLTRNKIKVNVDAYLALAENAVGSRSFRPGDILTARNGQKVEIHNTDAEGRLVLSDAIDVAVTQEGKDKPHALIDFATLTGACRVALGTDVGGLFANDDRLAKQLEKSGQTMGDPLWRLPLYDKYFQGFNTPFADFTNATEMPGGAITAALFLQKFVRDVPWAHLDIFCWQEGEFMGERGGSGQAVQLMINYFSTATKKA